MILFSDLYDLYDFCTKVYNVFLFHYTLRPFWTGTNFAKLWVVMGVVKFAMCRQIFSRFASYLQKIARLNYLVWEHSIRAWVCLTRRNIGHILFDTSKKKLLTLQAIVITARHETSAKYRRKFEKRTNFVCINIGRTVWAVAAMTERIRISKYVKLWARDIHLYFQVSRTNSLCSCH